MGKGNLCRLLKIKIAKFWPEYKSDYSVVITNYWKSRHELLVVKQIFLKESKSVISRKLQKEMLQKIHEDHLGIEKCKQQACKVMYWPRINNNIINW